MADLSEKVPITARLLLRESLTARRAAGIIAGFTVLITLAGGILERLVDHQEFPTIGRDCGSRSRRSRPSDTATSPPSRRMDDSLLRS